MKINKLNLDKTQTASGKDHKTMRVLAEVKGSAKKAYKDVTRTGRVCLIYCYTIVADTSRPSYMGSRRSCIEESITNLSKRTQAL